ncbi:MAG: nucleotidyltransferase domain-containing protein [Synergistales bacterium]|nr:nucleotidyltransferase domain-containing protein [Synergistales bacterium]
MAVASLSKREILHQLREMKITLYTRYGVTRIGLFGSFARDEATGESDVDIVVEMPPDLLGAVALREELAGRLQVSVDVVRYRSHMNPRLKRRIDREACYV